MSKIDVRNEALKLSEQTDDYNEPDGTVATKADALLSQLHEEWIDDRLVKWELDNIPLRAENAATQILGYELGKRNRTLKPIKLAALREGAIIGEATLRKQAAVTYNGEPVKADYF